MRLTLLVPELIWPEPGDLLTLDNLPTPAFSWLAARASFLRSTRLGYEKSLASLFGQNDMALAALRLAGEASAPAEHEGTWLCADPVHLRFHQERIVLADGGAFEIDEAEAGALVDSLNAEFADVGHFYAATARRWYLRLNAAVDHVAEPISAVSGRRMDGELENKTSPLHRWLNEVQMFLHDHPINTARQSRGQPAINSLWLWGGGTRPQARAEVDAVWSDDPLAVGLARLNDLATHPQPPSLPALLARPSAAPLAVLDSLLAPVLYESPEGWRAGWEQLEADWFAPLRAQLGKRIERLDILAPTIYGQLHWTIRSGERWKFWKKGRTLAEMANTLAEGNAS